MRSVIHALLFIALLGPAAAGARTEVFTIAGLPVTDVPDSARVVELDLPARMDKRLSQGLSANEKDAAAMVRQRLAGFKTGYGQAYRGLVRAWRLGVQRVPAVVVDGQYVVYGQPNIALALDEIREARQSEGTP